MSRGEEWFFFDEGETELIERALGALPPKRHGELLEMLARLGRHAALIRDAPPIATSWDAGSRRPFSVESLLEKLCDVEEYDLDLHVPTKAIVGQAFLIAKINALKALGYMLAAASAPVDLIERVGGEVAQSIYTKLAEELFVAIVTDHDASRFEKMGAGRFLYRIWEDRLLTEIDDFAPLLESAWGARSKLLPVLGTMLGTHEVFRLFREARDQRLLDYFGDDGAPPEQLLAFEEFLFGLSHEEITQIRASMSAGGKQVISRDEAHVILGKAPRPIEEETGALALYTSYKKRRVNALHRALSGAGGPKKTAEEYVMLAFLRSGMTPSVSALKAVPPARG